MALNLKLAPTLCAPPLPPSPNPTYLLKGLTGIMDVRTVAMTKFVLIDLETLFSSQSERSGTKRFTS